MPTPRQQHTLGVSAQLEIPPVRDASSEIPGAWLWHLMSARTLSSWYGSVKMHASQSTVQSIQGLLRGIQKTVVAAIISRAAAALDGAEAEISSLASSSSSCADSSSTALSFALLSYPVG